MSSSNLPKVIHNSEERICHLMRGLAGYKGREIQGFIEIDTLGDLGHQELSIEDLFFEALELDHQYLGRSNKESFEQSLLRLLALGALPQIISVENFLLAIELEKLGYRQ